MKRSTPAALGAFTGWLLALIAAIYWQRLEFQALKERPCGLYVIVEMAMIGAASFLGCLIGGCSGMTRSWWKGGLVGAGIPQLLLLIPWLMSIASGGPHNRVWSRALEMGIAGLVVGGLTGAVGQLASRGMKTSEDHTLAAREN